MNLQDTTETREAMVSACVWMNAEGINQGTSGNISVQVDDGVLITPSGLPYADIAPEMIVKIPSQGAPEDAGLAPSVEWPFHQALQAARPDMPVVLHAHPPHCSALAIQRRGIPACHYMVAIFGGDDVPLVDYALFGSEALSDGLTTAMKDRTGCIMANHGATVLGETIEKAKWRLRELETLAQTYLLSHIGGQPQILSFSDVAEVLAAISDYGQK